MRELSGEELDALTAGQGGRPPAEIERDLAIPSLTRLRLISAGPSASVFRAYQTATQRTVAVKVLHDELSSDVGQRFDRERAITGQLSGHTGVVPLLHTGTTADGEPYLVLPYYRRGSLADLMGRYGPLPWREATFLLKPVASTVAEVHLWGLVHRNLKPSNILLTDFLRPRVADFGMCLPLDQTSTAATLVDGPYAPEESGLLGPADPTMDVFGLAATLWALLAGRPLPTDGSDRRQQGADEMAIATGKLGRPRPPAVPGADTPARIAELIERSMSLDQADRPQTVAAFLADLGHDDFRSNRADGRQRGRTMERQVDHAADASSAGTTSDSADTVAPEPNPGPDVEGFQATEPQRGREGSGGSTLGNQASGTSRTTQPSQSAPAAGSDVGLAVRTDSDRDGQGGSAGDVATAAEADLEAHTDDGGGSLQEDVQIGRTVTSDVYYLLALVALISTGIIVMVAAAIWAY